METSEETFHGERLPSQFPVEKFSAKTNSTFNNLSSGPEAVINYMGSMCESVPQEGNQGEKSKAEFDKLS